MTNPDAVKVFKLFDKLKRNRSSQTKPDEILFNCLIDMCVRFGDLQHAMSVFSDM